MSIPRFLYVQTGTALSEEVEKKLHLALKEHKIQTRIIATIYPSPPGGKGNYGYVWVESLAAWNLCIGKNADGTVRRKVPENGLTEEDMHAELEQDRERIIELIAEAEAAMKAAIAEADQKMKTALAAHERQLAASPESELPAAESPKKFGSSRSWADASDDEDESPEQKKMTVVRASSPYKAKAAELEKEYKARCTEARKQCKDLTEQLEQQFQDKATEMEERVAATKVEDLPSLIKIGDWHIFDAQLKPGVKGTVLQFDDTCPKWLTHQVIAGHFKVFGEPTVAFVRGAKPRVSISFKDGTTVLGLSVLKKYMTFTNPQGGKPYSARTWLA